jgi:hypothetical protein
MALKNAGVEKGAEIGSLTLAHPFRWRLTNASVGNRAKFGSLTLAHLLPGRWEALAKRMRQPQAEIFLMLMIWLKRLEHR